LKKRSVEFQLLLACLRWPLNETDRNRIISLVRVSLDATRFLDLVSHHQIVPIVFRNLDNAARRETPDEILSKLRDKALVASKQSFQRVIETIRLATELQRLDIDIRILKGVALSIHAYGDATLQDSIDIDLLVPVAQLFEAEKVLLQCGYRRIIPYARLTPRRISWVLNHAHHFVFAHAQTRDTVELHWGLTGNPYKHEAFAAGRTSTTRLQVGANQIPSLAPQDMFLHACVHGAEHCWSRLKWLAQIAAMLRAMTPEESRAIVARACEFGVNAELAAAIALTDHYHLAATPKTDAPLESSRAVDRIVTRSLKAIDEGAAHSNHALVDFRDAWQAGGSFNYRRNLIERTIIREESWNIVDLPDSLFFGYALLAPIAWFQHRNRKHKPRPARGEPLVVSTRTSDLEHS
jgi:hypothetical protein